MASKRKAQPAASLDSLAEFDRVLDKALTVAQTNPDALPGMHERQGNPRPLAPRVPETDEWVQRQVENAQLQAAKWKEKTLRPRKDPIAAAKAAAGKYKQKMQAALQEGAWEKGIAAVDEEAMIETIEQTDPEVYSAGIRRRQRKIRSRVEKLRPLVVGLAETIDKMPQDTDQQREQRMIAARRGMIEIGKRMRS